MGFLIPQFEGVLRQGGYLAIDFLGCFHSICSFNFGLRVAEGGTETPSWFVGLRGSLPSMKCRSLSTAAIDLSLNGFLEFVWFLPFCSCLVGLTARSKVKFFIRKDIL